jgi:hypothetical protein
MPVPWTCKSDSRPTWPIKVREAVESSVVLKIRGQYDFVAVVGTSKSKVMTNPTMEILALTTSNSTIHLLIVMRGSPGSPCHDN